MTTQVGQKMIFGIHENPKIKWPKGAKDKRIVQRNLAFMKVYFVDDKGMAICAAVKECDGGLVVSDRSCLGIDFMIQEKSAQQELEQLKKEHRKLMEAFSYLEFRWFQLTRPDEKELTPWQRFWKGFCS